jgi:predicted phage baseplate assembly protein
VDPDTLQLQVEEPERGYQLWQRVDDLALAGRDSAVYSLDSEAGTVRFGNGVRGRIPPLGARVRVAFMRAGGGLAGNLPPGALDDILASNLLGEQVQRLKVRQALATDQGEDAETLDRAEQRVPALLRHQSRAVTTEDYQRLAAETPGVRLGRVEVLPRFKPQQRRTGEQVPGVVSVMVWPFKEGFQPPNPRPDRPTREAVHAYLEARRPLTTEMYVIGCEYIALGISIGITVLGETGDSAPGEPIVGRDTVLMNVREAVRRYLWPLPPGGVAGSGWALGRAIRDRELEVVVARVAGVDTVSRVNLFIQNAARDDWEILPRATLDAPVELPLLPWQLPELLSIVVTADGEAPDDLRGVNNPFASPESIAIPVVPKLC